MESEIESIEIYSGLMPWFGICNTELDHDDPYQFESTGPKNMPPKESAPIADFLLILTDLLTKHFLTKTNQDSF